jgi:CheY-like chemotaxis protein
MAEVTSGEPFKLPRFAARVLVVDDNRDAADSLAILLRLRGNSVEVAYDGQSGLDRARSFRPQSILLDISMPGMHGGQVARQLRGLPDCREAMIVATTANEADDPKLDEWRSYFDSFLAKPCNLATLERLLATHTASGT